MIVAADCRIAFSSRVRNARCSARRQGRGPPAPVVVAELVAYVKGDPAKQQLGDCPFSHRVLLALEAKHIPYTTQYINFKEKPAWLQEISGGKVPVINLDGEWIADSDRIVAVLDERFPEPSLRSEAPPDLGAKLFPAFREYLQSHEPESVDKQRALENELQKVNDYLLSKGPLFGGSKVDGMDASIAPKLYHIVVALKHFKGWTLPESCTAIAKYLQTIKEDAAWKATDYGETKIIEGWAAH